MNRPFAAISRRFQRHLHARRALYRVALMVIAFGLLLSVSGAFDTSDLGIVHRSALWIGVVGLIAGQFIAFAHLVARTPGLRRLGLTGGRVLAFLATWLLATLEVEAMKYTPLLNKQPDPLLAFAVFMLPVVALICLAVIAVHVLAGGPQSGSDGAGRDAELLPPPLPGLKPGEWPAGAVLSIEAQDHYLNVVTEHGQALIRGSMGEAMSRVDRTAGLRVHRSWWVARDAVARPERRGRDWVLILMDGRAAPVARSRAAELRRAGWL